MKRKTTVYREDDVLKAMRVAPARAGNAIIRWSRRRCTLTLMELLEQVGARSSLGVTEALDLAYEELHHGRS